MGGRATVQSVGETEVLRHLLRGTNNERMQLKHLFPIAGVCFCGVNTYNGRFALRGSCAM